MALPVCRISCCKLWGSSGYRWTRRLPARSESLWQELPSHNLETKQWANGEKLISPKSSCLRVCTQRMRQNTFWAWQELPGVSLFLSTAKNLQFIALLRRDKWYKSACSTASQGVWEATCICCFLGWFKNFSFFTWALVSWWKRRLFPNAHLIKSTFYFLGFFKAFPYFILILQENQLTTTNLTKPA